MFPYEAEIHIAINQPQQVILGNLLFQPEIVEQRFGSRLLTIIVGAPP